MSHRILELGIGMRMKQGDYCLRCGFVIQLALEILSFALFYELYGYPNEKNMSMEQEENPNENIDNVKSSKVSAKSTNKTTGKIKMTKEERSRLMKEKKLLKELNTTIKLQPAGKEALHQRED
ncbi:crossover junction endonuclease EME1B [Trifolium repens]|nr:crossover junction endonuclease EME1B [Trifolium repens]